MALLDDVLRVVGTSRVRLAWKWRNAREGLARRRRALANRGQALAYGHQACPRCHHPAGADERRCTRCGERLYGAGVQRARRALGWLGPGDAPIVTVTLLAACTAMFLLTAQLAAALGERFDDPAIGNSLALARFGAASTPSIAAGEWWRLVTAMFLHIDLLHLVMNGFGLWLAGSAVEELFGRARTLVGFVATGLAGSVASHAWHASTTPVLSAGASGAILGLVGIVIGHALRYRRGRGAELRRRFVPFAVYAVIMGFGIGADNAAHLGGLAAGLAIGALLGDRQAARRLPRPVWLGLAAVALGLVVVAFVLAHRHGDVLGLTGALAAR